MLPSKGMILFSNFLSTRNLENFKTGTNCAEISLESPSKSENIEFPKANQLKIQEIVELIVKLNGTGVPSKKFAFGRCLIMDVVLSCVSPPLPEVSHNRRSITFSQHVQTVRLTAEIVS